MELFSNIVIIVLGGAFTLVYGLLAAYAIYLCIDTIIELKNKYK